MPAHVVMHAASTAIVVIRIVPLLSACTGGLERCVCVRLEVRIVLPFEF
jgi:hypothetical protein